MEEEEEEESLDDPGAELKSGGSGIRLVMSGKGRLKAGVGTSLPRAFDRTSGKIPRLSA